MNHMTIAGGFDFSKIKQVKVSKIKAKLDWDLILCILALFLIILELVTYELEFSSDRTHGNCKHNEVEWLKFIVLGLSLVGVSVIFMKYKQKKFKQNRSILPLAESFTMIFVTYPYADAHIKYQQSTNLTSISGTAISRELCYTLSEALYLVGFAKSYFIYKYLLIKIDSKKSSKKLHRADLMSEDATGLSVIYFVAFVGLMTLAILAEFLRVSERPFIDVTNLNYESYFNCIWCLFCSLTSIGYGDFYPVTHVGRLAVLLSSALGALFLGLVLFFFSKFTALSSSDLKTMKIIDRNRTCGIIVVNSLVYFHFLNKLGKNDKKTQDLKLKLLKSIENSNFNFKYRAYRSTKPHKKALKKALKIEGKLDKFNFAIN